MVIVVILLFLVLLIAAIVCPYRILKNPLTSGIYRVVTIISGCILAALTYYLTFHYVYFSGANTRVRGWPFPQIVFEQKTPDGPWLDFVGPTLLLAFPINLIILSGVWFFLLWFINFVIIKITKRTAVQKTKVKKENDGNKQTL